MTTTRMAAVTTTNNGTPTVRAGLRRCAAVTAASLAVLLVVGFLAAGVSWTLLLGMLSPVMGLFALVSTMADRRERRRKFTEFAPSPQIEAIRLLDEAQVAARHAREYDLPPKVWDQLTALWRIEADLPLDTDPAGSVPLSGLAVDWASASEATREQQIAIAGMVLDGQGITAPDHDPFMDELRAAMCTPLRERTAGSLGLTAPDDDPFDFDAFVQRTRPKRRTTTDPTASAALNPVRRITWTLAGTDEDTHVLDALRRHGVRYGVESGASKVAHLSGIDSAIRAAEADYRAGFEKRKAEPRTVNVVDGSGRVIATYELDD